MSTTTEKELRDLDAWIHEHVFGRTFKWISRTDDAFGGAEFTSDRDWLVDDYLDVETNRRMPAYSTDPSAALPVLQKCAEHSELLECIYVGKIADEWMVGLDSLRIEELANTLPLAICKFAKSFYSKMPAK